MSTLVVLGAVLVTLTIFVIGALGWQLLRQNGRILLRLDELEQRLNELEFGGGTEPGGLTVGSEAPAFELPDLAGERQSLAQFRGQPVLLIFFNPDCGFCREMAPMLAQFSEGRAPRAPESPRAQGGQGRVEPGLPTDGCPLVIILTTGDAEENRQLFAEHKVSCPVLRQNDAELSKAYRAHGTPSGYLISAEGRIASKLALGADALMALATAAVRETPLPSSNGQGERGGEGDRASRFSHRSLARSKIQRDGLKAGTPAPDFRLPRLDGKGDLGLNELSGRRLLLVFSSPECGPCNSLAPELEKFHRESARLQVVMISKGEPDENRAKVKEHGLTFPVLLQRQWEISRLYAMFATPIAYLIDEAGIISHDVAVGTDSITALLKQVGSRQDAVPARG